MPTVDEVTVHKRSMQARVKARRYYKQHRRRIKAIRSGKIRVRLTMNQKKSVAKRKRSGIFHKTARLYNSVEALPMTTIGEITHPRSYISAVLEAASGIPDMLDAREFANFFIDRDPLYSNTATGMHALMFENWLAAEQAEMFGRLVETQVEAGEVTFLAVFEGKLTDEEKKRIDEKVEFAKFEMVVEAGAVIPDEGEVSDVTILEGTPVKGKKFVPNDAMANTPATPAASTPATPPVGEGATPVAEGRVLPSGNESYGFYGTIKLNDKADADKLWTEMSNALAKKFPAATPKQIRDFLDSRIGRHMADQVTDDQTPETIAGLKWVSKDFTKFIKTNKVRGFGENAEIALGKDDGKDLAEDKGRYDEGTGSVNTMSTVKLDVYHTARIQGVSEETLKVLFPDVKECKKGSYEDGDGVVWSKSNGAYHPDLNALLKEMMVSEERTTEGYGKMLTYGKLPDFAWFEKAFDEELPDGRYRIHLGREDSEAAEGTSIGDGTYTAKELYKGLKELVVKMNSDEDEEIADNAGSLASSIMSTLGFEWV